MGVRYEYMSPLHDISKDLTNLLVENGKLTAFIGGQNAPVVYSIASPGFAGLYQIAVTVPSGVTGSADVVVKAGTATSAQIPGITVAGKTGTAEVANGTGNQAWFIAFAPVDHPKIAVAVTVERTSGQGGTVAAPIAKQVMEALLGG